ncbi:MAG: hypothetical protein N2444_07450, partial [Methylocystis sp.]|nr:hypothetical protein [Methylocystis sp.]
MLIAREKETERVEHPVDVVEQLATCNDWTFDRESEDENDAGNALLGTILLITASVLGLLALLASPF